MLGFISDNCLGIGPPLVDLTQAFLTPEETGTDTSVMTSSTPDNVVSGVNAEDGAWNQSSMHEQPAGTGSRHADETLPDADKITGLAKTAGGSKDSNGIGLFDVAANTADCLGLLRALADAAKSLVEDSGVPGISAAASVVEMLVNMVMDHKANPGLMRRSVKWCSFVVAMLRRAEDILRKASVASLSTL